MHASLALALTGLITYIIAAVFHTVAEKVDSQGGQLLFGIIAILGYVMLAVGIAWGIGAFIWWIWSAI